VDTYDWSRWLVVGTSVQLYQVQRLVSLLLAGHNENNNDKQFDGISGRIKSPRFFLSFLGRRDQMFSLKSWEYVWWSDRADGVMEYLARFVSPMSLHEGLTIHTTIFSAGKNNAIQSNCGFSKSYSGLWIPI
jgi:hypothetical protein